MQGLTVRTRTDLNSPFSCPPPSVSFLHLCCSHPALHTGLCDLPRSHFLFPFPQAPRSLALRLSVRPRLLSLPPQPHSQERQSPSGPDGPDTRPHTPACDCADSGSSLHTFSNQAGAVTVQCCQRERKKNEKESTLVKTRLVHCLLADELKDKVTIEINIQRNVTIDRQQYA